MNPVPGFPRKGSPRPKARRCRAKHLFEVALEQARRQYSFYVTGYVVMPEHVHLLVS
jgi:REP-associated tyrosine transposase